SLGASGLYGPNMNCHRTAYSGRNFEYYSEDPFLSGTIAAAEVAGIQSKGAYVYIKHFALNDAETNCRCLSTFANEQAIREVYLEPFRKAIEDGGAHNVMNSFARVGTTWTGAHEGLMTNVLRGEWGMDGFAITDFSGNSAFAAYGIKLRSFDVAHGVLAGTDMWDSSATQWTDDLNQLYAEDPSIVSAMRESSHRILYTVANSSAMNGIDADTRIVEVTPWWQIALPALVVVILVLAVLSIARLVKGVKMKKAMK
ncbi:glycoside hydrolase family 3 N-terminal domain-containing protein, partial [Thermophilibacter provencensis]